MADIDVVSKPIVAGEQAVNDSVLTNGLANGTSDHKEHRDHKDHKHKSRDKEKDKDRDKDRDKSKDKDKDKDKYKERHRDKDRHKSSHRDKDKDKERSKDKDRHSSSHKSSQKDKDRDREKSRDKDKSDRDKDKSDRDKDKSDRDKDKSDRDKDKSDRDKERSDRDKDKSDRDKDKHKDKVKDEKDKHKDKERSDKDRHREKDKERSDKYKDKEKERSREKDKEKRDDKEKRSSTSSGNGDKKDRHHSSHKSSHKDKSRDRDREKHREKEEKIKIEIKPEIKQQIEPEPELEPVEEKQSQYEALQVKEETMDYQEESTEFKEEAVESEEDSQLVIKEEKLEEDDDDDAENDNIPLSSRKRIKVEEDEDDEDDTPLIARKKVKTERKRKKKDDEDDDDFKPQKKKIKKEKAKAKKKNKGKGEKMNNSQGSMTESPKKKEKKEKEEEHVWKWWEEEKRDDGNKWTFLEHKGPVFPDEYVRLPSHVKFYYKGEHVALSEETEEVAGFYARMLDHDYTTKEMFNKNFFRDWRKVMTSKERELIIDLTKCDFKRYHAFFLQQNEERKNKTKEDRKILREKNEKIIAEYGWCTIDGHKQRIGNFKIEPPGLFRGRGEHPKQGMHKKRTTPEEVRINCSKDSVIPKPPAGHKWKEVRHDPTVTWLACWNENIQGSTKYVMLNAASKLKGEKDWQKYESARRLHKHVDKIREKYRADWKSKEMRVRQRGVALYFIDKLALRAGNEKDEDQADTVGCCSLRVEHLKLYEQKDGKEFVVVFDFLGKDSIRYYNEVPVEKRVFKNLQLFMENKQEGDDVFDRLNTQILNKHLNELLDGLTAKVFRTYNASRTLQEQLERVTNPDDPLPAQILSYNRANREVAILCNHQRAVPKTFDKSMANLQKKIDDKRDLIADSEKELKDLKKAAKHGGSVKEKTNYDKKKKAIERLKEQLGKLEISATDKEENKQIALGTSKLNYLDPRITIAWCKKNNIPIDKVYNKTQRQKFQWAIDMATADYNFMGEPSNQSFSKNTGEEEEEEVEEEEEEE